MKSPIILAKANNSSRFWSWPTHKYTHKHTRTHFGLDTHTYTDGEQIWPALCLFFSFSFFLASRSGVYFTSKKLKWHSRNPLKIVAFAARYLFQIFFFFSLEYNFVLFVWQSRRLQNAPWSGGKNRSERVAITAQTDRSRVATMFQHLWEWSKLV